MKEHLSSFRCGFRIKGGLCCVTLRQPEAEFTSLSLLLFFWKRLVERVAVGLCSITEGDTKERMEGVYPTGSLCLFLSHKQIFILPACPVSSLSLSPLLSFSPTCFLALPSSIHAWLSVYVCPSYLILHLPFHPFISKRDWVTLTSASARGHQHWLTGLILRCGN